MSAYNPLPLQSPIDLGKALPITRTFPPDSIALHWESAVNGVIRDREHGKEIEFDHSTATIDVQVPGQERPTRFTLSNLHFHYRSEHRVNDYRWPLELHIVHKATEPNPFDPKTTRVIYAVVGVMVEGGGKDEAAGKALKGIIEWFKAFGEDESVEKAGTSRLPEPLNPNHLVPFDPTTPITDMPFWRYEGSLTSKTQEPNDGYVSWVVLKTPLKISDETLATWRDALKHEAKVPQDLDRRFVFLNPGRGTSPLV